MKTILNLIFLTKIKERTLIVAASKNYNIQSSVFLETLKKEETLQTFFFCEKDITEEVKIHLFENIFPSYAIVKNGELEELGVILN